MTELEKIEYAKSFIDKLANGINPLDNTPIPEDDISNNVRISRCFFYVSGILGDVIARERRSIAKPQKPAKLPFSITSEQLADFEYSEEPISSTSLAKKINFFVRGEIERNNMQRFSYKKIIIWLLDNGFIENRPWENESYKRFPTPAGEEIGLVLHMWESYGRRSPNVYLTKEAQRFIIDNIEAVIAVETKGKKISDGYGSDQDDED